MADPRQLLEDARTIAVVGISANPSKSAFGVPAGLQAAGYRIVPVNPSADRVLGERAFATLTDVREPIDIVEVFRPSAEAAGIARQAVEIGATALWLQKGITSAEARQIAEDAGLAYVEDLCMGVERSRYGIVKD
jgi:uncharacterized protein